MNGFTNPGMEIDLAWDLGAGASYSTNEAYAGLRSLRLLTTGSSASAFASIGPVSAGDEVPVSGWLKATGTGTLPSFTVSYYAAGVPLTQIYQRGLFTSNWYNWSDSFTAPLDGDYTILVAFDISSGSMSLYLDDLEADIPEEEAVFSRSHMAAFLANLQTLIADVDPHLGPVFIAGRRWASSSDLKDDGAIIQINVDGLFDEVDALGPATRFWILEPVIRTRPLTLGGGGTVQYDALVKLFGFFGWKDDNSQAGALQAASGEIIDALLPRSVESTTLAVDMGDGYMGFLGRIPQMAGPLRDAEIEGVHAQGHLAELSVAYHEEVPRVA